MIGRLRAIEGRLAQAYPGRNWPWRIEKACEQYNDTRNSSTKMAPNEVNHENSNIVFRRLFKPFAMNWKMEKILKLGTHVRLKLENRTSFTKANVPRNTREIFVIRKIRLHPSGVKYKLFTLNDNMPIAGTWFASEFIPISVPQK